MTVLYTTSMAADSILVMRLPAEVRNALAAAAAKHDRPLSSQARYVLTEWLIEKDFLSRLDAKPSRPQVGRPAKRRR